jgi:hypothetical protein
VGRRSGKSCCLPGYQWRNAAAPDKPDKLELYRNLSLRVD